MAGDPISRGFEGRVFGSHAFEEAAGAVVGEQRLEGPGSRSVEALESEDVRTVELREERAVEEARGVQDLKQVYPEAAVLVHPESPASVIELADRVGSTTQIIKAAQEMEHHQ